MVRNTYGNLLKPASIGKMQLKNRICMAPIHQNNEVDDFRLSAEDMVCIEAMDRGRSMILDIPSLDEVYRLHGITFEQ